MREIEAIWFRGLAEKKFTWTMLEFFEELLRFLPLRRLPPMSILNLYSTKGEVDWGMSGGIRWKPFEVNEAEYEVVAQHLAHQSMVTDQEFENEIDWEAFCYSRLFGIPEHQFKKFKQEVLHRELQWKKAMLTNSKEKISRTYTKFIEASEAYRTLVRQYTE